MPTRSSTIWLSSLATYAAGVFAACLSTGIGQPCASDSDCDTDLVCDLHEDQGTCQEDHGHGGDHETGAEVDCAAEDRDDEYAVGLSKTGASITATFVSADPTPPALGDNSWVLSFSDADGAALDGLDIVVTPMMPDHGDGTPVEVVVTPTENPGEYSFTPVNLVMAGLWEITFDVTMDGGQDSLMFAFCVE